MIAIIPGLMAGLGHVFSGPDHLAALAPWSMEQRGRAWVVGIRWGLGHATGAMVVGMLSLWLREMLPLDWLSSWAERLVGVMLIGVGIWGFRKALAKHLHAHTHAHDGVTHVHFHYHDGKAAHNPEILAMHSHSHAAFGVGALHGVAGSSHLWGVLPALAFASAGQAIGYLAAFGLGTILAMAMFTSVVGWLARVFAFGGARVYRALMVGCSTLAVGLGTYWLLF